MALPKPPEKKRSYVVKISLSPAVGAKLEQVAEVLGLAPSQIAAIAVSEYAAAKAIAFSAAERSSQQMIEAMGPHMADLFQSLAAKEIKE